MDPLSRGSGRNNLTGRRVMMRHQSISKLPPGSARPSVTMRATMYATEPHGSCLSLISLKLVVCIHTRSAEISPVAPALNGVVTSRRFEMHRLAMIKRPSAVPTVCHYLYPFPLPPTPP